MLPVPTNEAQNSFMTSWLSSNSESYTWLAVTDTANEGTFVNLATNEEITYVPWRHDQPKSDTPSYDYVYMTNAGQWAVYQDEGPEIFMCMKGKSRFILSWAFFE